MTTHYIQAAYARTRNAEETAAKAEKAMPVNVPRVRRSAAADVKLASVGAADPVPSTTALTSEPSIEINGRHECHANKKENIT